jgi:hypothetical protein
VLSHLENAYAVAALQVEARYAAREDVALVESTWAKKLAFSPSARAFVEIRGTIQVSPSARAFVEIRGTIQA